MDNRLTDAVHNNDMRQVIALLASGMPVDIRGRHGVTGLMVAVMDGNKKMVDFLLSRNARVDAEDSLGGFPLNYAVCNNRLSIIYTLIAHKADVNAGGSTGVTALMDACSFGYPDIAVLLIKIGANINAQARANGMTALIQAVWSHEYNCAKLLLAHGANKTLRDRTGETALTYARKNQDTKMLKLLSR